MMIIAIITIIAGIPFGFLLRSNKIMQVWVGHALNVSVWVLLFLLGVGLGVDDSLMGQLDTLGLQALFISSFATLGTLVGAWLVGKYAFSDSLVEHEKTHGSGICSASENAEIGNEKIGDEIIRNVEIGNADGEKQSKLNALKDSFIVLTFFAGGMFLGAYPFVSMEWALGNTAAGALYVLLFLAGMSVGFDLKAFRILRELKGKILLVLFVAILGTLLASPLACFIFPDLRIIDAMAVGAGLGYYSLSSTMISQEISTSLGSVALLSNMMREIFTLVFAPIMVRYFGRLGPVMAGGATSNDSSLPVIAKYCGERYAIIAIFSGVFLTLLVPILVSFILYFA